MVAGQCFREGKYVPTPEAHAYYQWVMAMKQAKPDEDFIHGNFGVQTEYLTTKAKICIYGGAAAGGKSFAGLMYPTQFMDLPNFRSIMFRRETTDLTKPGGLQEEAQMLYEPMSGKLNETHHSFSFDPKIYKHKPIIQLGHIQHPKNTEDWKGSQLCLAYFDELTTFTEEMFWFIYGRCRTSTDPRRGCPMNPILRASTNPDPHSFVRKLIAWWIGKDGLAIKERSGIIRWLARDPNTGEYHWGDTQEEVQLWIDQFYKDEDPEWIPEPISLTFIHAELKDNPYMTKADRARLAMLSPVERARQEDGNWDAVAEGGDYFQESWVKRISHNYIKAMILNNSKIQLFRGYDLAYTAQAPGKDPDETVGVLMAYDPDENRYYVIDVKHGLYSGSEFDTFIYNTAKEDAEHFGERRVTISLPAGGFEKHVANTLIGGVLKGCKTHTSPEKGSKEDRFFPFSGQARLGNVTMINEPKWNNLWINQLVAFKGSKATKGHDDMVDATSRAFNAITESNEDRGYFGRR